MAQMLNTHPIFLVGFARGGTNIVLNFLRSHPDVCCPRGELTQVFKGQRSEPYHTRFVKLLRYSPILVAEKRDIFGAWLWEDRPAFSSFTKNRIDNILYHERFGALLPSENLYRYENIKYTFEQLAQARLFCKNLNGLIFISRNLAEMYSDATFIGLVRNGFAVCEGHIRRRRYSANEIAMYYQRGCQRLIEDSQRIKNFHIFRFEDVIEHPVELLKKIYMVSELELQKVNKLKRTGTLKTC